MNNRCVEHVLEDNKWTVLVLIVSDDIGILGNSHMGIRAQQHHEHRSFHTKRCERCSATLICADKLRVHIYIIGMHKGPSIYYVTQKMGKIRPPLPPCHA